MFDTLRRNKLRTFLTATSVAWGIFMLVILLGAGKGLENGVRNDFRDDAINSLWIWGGRTSIPYKGLPVGRQVEFTNDDYELLKTADGVDKITGRFYIRGDLMVSYGAKASAFEVRATHPDHLFLEQTIITSGRFLNDIDIAERRKVCVVGIRVAEFLFGLGVDPIGEWINVNNIAYRIVGVFEDIGGEGELRKVYIPIATAQTAYGGADRIHQLMFTVGDATPDQTKQIEAATSELLGERHDFASNDPRALRVRNNVENFERISRVFSLIRIFVWIVGAGTIIAGMVGVSNIMLISVRERTREFGVRKALGATPWSIVSMVTTEALVLTAVSGYVGMVFGVGILEAISRYMPPNDYLRAPSVELGVVVIATVILTVCGIVAGFFPARSAAKVDPIVALRDE